MNAFNSYGVGQVFLLSTTAGGAGLNLVGANRLVRAGLPASSCCMPGAARPARASLPLLVVLR